MFLEDGEGAVAFGFVIDAGEGVSGGDGAAVFRGFEEA